MSSNIIDEIITEALKGLKEDVKKSSKEEKLLIATLLSAVKNLRASIDLARPLIKHLINDIRGCITNYEDAPSIRECLEDVVQEYEQLLR